MTLTPDGAALRSRAVAVLLAWLRSTLAGWQPDDTAALAELLGRFADAVVGTAGPGGPPPCPRTRRGRGAPRGGSRTA